MKHKHLTVATLTLLVAAALRIIGLSGYPPGPHYDEAVNLIITRTVAFGGATPFPMVENFQGREVLYYYLSAPVITLIHDSRFALQLVGVYSNLILVAATMALGRVMFPGQRGRWVALAAGIVAAVSLPQVLLARQAFRAITLPMLQALALLFLWRGLQRGHYRPLLVAGLFAGLAVYTYNSSRLFPVWLAVGGLVLVGLSSGERWLRLRQGSAFFAVFIALAAPFAVYAVQRPDVFFGRLYEVTGGTEDITLAESVTLHARMFFIQGETLLRYNPPGRPYFTPPEALFLSVGLGVAGWTLFRRRTPPLDRVAGLMLLLSPLMIFPSVLATSGFPPNHMRSIAMVPLIFVMVGLGFTWMTARLSARWRGVLLLLALGVGGIVTARDYAAWVTRADLFYDTDADLAALAGWAQEKNTGTPVYIAAQDHFHPTVQVYKLAAVRWLGTDTLFLPPDEPRVALFPRSAPPTAALAAWLDEAALSLTDLPTGPDGRTAFTAYELSPGTMLPLTSPDAAIHNAHLSFVGAFDGAAFHNTDTDILTAWEVNTPPSAIDLTPIVHLEDSLGNVIARAESFSIGTDRWEPGETLLQRVPGLRVPIGTPPGRYPLRMAWVERNADRYLTYQGDAGGIWATVGTLEVLRPPSYPATADLPIAVHAEQEVVAGVNLVGWATLPNAARPGETLPLTLHWAATDAESRADLQYTVRLGDTELRLDAPMLAKHPTSSWSPGQLMTERLQVTLDREQALSTYPLRLVIADGPQVTLGTISVQGEPRLLEPPDVATVLDAQLGEALSLYGYTAITDDQTLTLELVWQALAPVTTDYTVFVHVTDPVTGSNTTQQDQMPRANTYPTSFWLPGEFVIDRYTFPLPTSNYELRVGMYDASNGVRLATSSPDNALDLQTP